MCCTELHGFARIKSVSSRVIRGLIFSVLVQQNSLGVPGHRILYSMSGFIGTGPCETLRNLCALRGLNNFYREGRRVYAKPRKR
jgi:hypothetical protein